METSEIKSFRALLRGFVRELGMLNNKVNDTGLSPLQSHILIELNSKVLNATSLAEILCVEKSSLSRTLKSLLNKQIIKSKISSHDNRQTLYMLTDEGKTLLDKIEIDSDMLLRVPLSLLSKDDYDSLQNGISSLSLKMKSIRKSSEMDINIRPIEEKDNQQIAAIIRESFCHNKIDHLEGVSLNDPHLNELSRYYSTPDKKYWVCTSGEKLLGGVGLAKIDVVKTEYKYCEMQKLYLAESALHLGLGRKLINFLIEQAANDGYDYCYIETLPELTKATNLYREFGFIMLEAPLIDTGHNNCSVRMLKKL